MGQLTNIKFDLFGSYCNEFPEILILHNNNVLHSGFVDSTAQLEFNIEIADNDLITVNGIGKSHGENNKWDTVLDQNGSIVSDKFLVINNILLDNIPMELPWIESLSSTGNFINHTFYSNGSISFTIRLPILDWIIEEKFISVEQQTGNEDVYSGSNRFDYKYIQNKIDSIKKLFDD